MYVVIEMGIPGQMPDPLIVVIATRATEDAAWQRATELAEKELAACPDPEAEIVDGVAFHGAREIYLDGDDGYICGWTVVVVEDDE